MSDERFHALLESHVDGGLDHADSRELLEAFAADPALKARFIEELRIANALHGLALLQADAIAPDVLSSIRLGSQTPDLCASVMAELKPAPAVRRFPWRLVAGLAAALALALILLPDPPPPLAVVAQLENADWDHAEGDTLPKGRVHLRDGVARLDFANGVRVTLQGPAEFELISPSETRLHAGTLSAHVPPEGIGFQVYTDSAEITDLGTTFGVAIEDDGSTSVLVFEGEVEVAPNDTEARKIIREGFGVNLANGDADLRPTRLQPVSFRPDWSTLFGVRNTGGGIKFINAQPIRNPREVVDGEHIIVFPERFHAHAPKRVVVTIASPGSYQQQTFAEGSTTLSLADRRVHTYLIQYNPPHVKDAPEAEQVSFSGAITFDRPILGVIANRQQLQATDGRLGKRRFDYDPNAMRGLEHGDSLTLSADRHTLTIDWLVMQTLKNGMDQIRVIVDAD